MSDPTPLKQPRQNVFSNWGTAILERFSFMMIIMFHLIQDGTLHAKGEARWTFPAAFVTCKVIVLLTFNMKNKCIHPRPSINTYLQHIPSHISQIDHQQFIKNMSIYKLGVLSPYFLSHFPSAPSICHSPGTEGVLLALRLGPGGGLPKLDQRGKIPSRWVC